MREVVCYVTVNFETEINGSCSGTSVVKEFRLRADPALHLMQLAAQLGIPQTCTMFGCAGDNSYIKDVDDIKELDSTDTFEFCGTHAQVTYFQEYEAAPPVPHRRARVLLELKDVKLLDETSIGSASTVTKLFEKAELHFPDHLAKHIRVKRHGDRIQRGMVARNVMNFPTSVVSVTLEGLLGGGKRDAEAAGLDRECIQCGSTGVELLYGLCEGCNPTTGSLETTRGFWQRLAEEA